jgi:hypothetical protein
MVAFAGLLAGLDKLDQRDGGVRGTGHLPAVNVIEGRS